MHLISRSFCPRHPPHPPDHPAGSRRARQDTHPTNPTNTHHPAASIPRRSLHRMPYRDGPRRTQHHRPTYGLRQVHPQFNQNRDDHQRCTTPTTHTPLHQQPQHHGSHPTSNHSSGPTRRPTCDGDRHAGRPTATRPHTPPDTIAHPNPHHRPLQSGPH